MIASALFTLFLSAMLINSQAGPIGLVKLGIDKTEENLIKPYGFGFNMDDGNGTTHYREENGNDKGEVRGKYGFVDAAGFYREVNYIADAEHGFQVKIKSNEPGLSNQNSANVQFVFNE